MRTPNTQCEICKNPLYRRPFEIKKAKGFCCVGCRSELYKRRPPSPNLELGREKGTNHLEGIPKSKASNTKRSKSHKKWCKDNPLKVKERGEKCRGEKHYNWKGGASKLNTSIRQMHENRKWMESVKGRDKKCVCGSIKNLEAHHLIPLKLLLEIHKITNRDEARRCKQLWDIKNGITLCRKCHYKIDNRKYNDND